MGHCDLDVAEPLRAAFVHWRGMFYSLSPQPVAQLKDTHDRGVVLFRYLHGVINVIEVTVRYKHGVDRAQVLFGFRARRIAHNPWINKDGFAGRGLNAEGRVTQPRNAQAVEVHDARL